MHTIVAMITPLAVRIVTHPTMDTPNTKNAGGALVEVEGDCVSVDMLMPGDVGGCVGGGETVWEKV